MSKQHTRGPWEMPSKPYIAGDTGEGAVFSGGDWEIVPPLGESGPVAVVSGEANAKLIAAAPVLLEALQSLVGVSPLGSETPLWRERESVVTRARAAIAKATE